MTLPTDWRVQVERAYTVFGAKFDPTVFEGWNPDEQWRAPEGSSEGGQYVEMPDVKATTEPPDTDAVAQSGEEAKYRQAVRKARAEGKPPPPPPGTKPPAKASTTTPAPKTPPKPKKKAPVTRFTEAGRKQFDKVRPGWRKATTAELREFSPGSTYSGMHINKNPNAHNPYKLFKPRGGTPKTMYTFEHHLTQERAKWARIERLRPQRKKLSQDLEKGVKEGDDTAAALKLALETGMRPSSDKAESEVKDAEGKTVVDENGDPVKEKTYGAGNVEARHVEAQEDGSVILDFTGKSAVQNRIHVADPVLAAEIKRRAENAQSPEDQLFPETDEVQMREMMKSMVGDDFSTKDLRTLWANIFVAQYFEGIMKENGHAPRNQDEFVAWIEQASLMASEKLGNEHATFKENYMSMLTFIKLFPDADIEDYWEWGKKMKDKGTLASVLPKHGPVDILTDEQLRDVYNRVNETMPSLETLAQRWVDNQGIADLEWDDMPIDATWQDPEDPIFEEEPKRVMRRPPLG